MRRSSKKRQWVGGILAGILLFGGLGVQAEETDSKEQPHKGETIVITATRTQQEEQQAPGKTEVITKEEITASGAATVAEALDDAGVEISSGGGASSKATVILDGSDTKQTLILVNGIPVNSGTGGYVDLSYFPVAGVKQIEVIRGPLSALYGANALGGVVNIITDLTGMPCQQLASSIGSNEYGSLALTVQQPKYGLAVGGLSTIGYRENSATSNGYLMGQYDFWQTQRRELRLNLLYNEKTYQSPGRELSNSKDDGRQQNLALDLVGKSVLDFMTVEYKLYGQNYHMKYHDAGKDAHDSYRTDIWGTDLAGIYPVGRHDLLGGIQLKNTVSHSTKVVGEHEVTDSGIVFQDSWKVNSFWQLISGLRMDGGSDYDAPICPRLGVNYLVSKELIMKLSYGKAFRAPTMDDLYWPVDTWVYQGKVYTQMGNPELNPETSERYEIAAEWKRENQSWSLNYFNSRIKDCIDWQENDYIWKPFNLKKMQVAGAGIDWRKQWNSTVKTQLKYAWIDKQAWDDLTQSYCIDKNDFGQNRTTIELDWSKGGWQSVLNCCYVSERNEQKADYALFNAAVGYRVNPKLNYTLLINNIIGKEYEIVKGYPMPGREYYLNASYSF